jgi:coenzyme F420 hydrogenase subunit beta
MNIKQKLLITTNAGVTKVSLSEVKPNIRADCRVCSDFSSELADISVGSLGLEGWTFTIIRSEKGEALFSDSEQAGFLRTKTVDAEPGLVDLLIKMSRKKSLNILMKK